MAEKRATLGTNVIPQRYTLEIEPLKGFRFSGREEIEVGIGKATSRIELNAAELRIGGAAVLANGSQQRARVLGLPKTERVALLLPRKISGSAVLRISFTGINNKKLHGFYRSVYGSGKGRKYVLTTQFEPVDARRCFPCFDEPALKARFRLSLVVGRGQQCISNTPIESVKRLAGGKKRVVFAETPRMSTYLLYIGIGSFGFAKSSVNGIRIEAAATRGKQKLAQLPADYAARFVGFYEKYFGIDYPLPKLHLLAIPDFAVGAMENWGAITFREARFLGDANTAIEVKQGIASVIAHELAHQWFGDLVTMAWWDDIWLNESFATFMSNKALASVFQEWTIDRNLCEYTLSGMSAAFSEDQLRSTHPISVSVADPDSISALFDSISYEKGSSVLRMLEDYVSEASFRKGLHNYLKAHSYANATKHDLWKAIGEASHVEREPMSIDDVASYWISKPGYPIVSAKLTGKGVRLTQRRFMLNNGGGGAGSWPIPVHYVLDGKERSLLLGREPAVVKAGKVAKYLKLNLGQKGFYRVQYDDKLTEALGDAMLHNRLSPADEFGVEDDMSALLRAGSLPLARYLSFVSRYCVSCSYPANVSIIGHLVWLYLVLSGTSYEKRVEKCISDICVGLFAKLGVEGRKGEKSTDALLRSAVLSALGRIGDAQAIRVSRELFSALASGRKKISSDIKGAVLANVAWSGTPEDFEKIRGMYVREKVPDDKLRYLSALGRFRAPELVSKALEFSISKEVRYQDTMIIIAGAASNPAAQRIIWKWVEKNWSMLSERYPPGTLLLRYFIRPLAFQRDREAMHEISGFMKRNVPKGSVVEPTAKQTLEFIEANIRLLDSLS